MTTPIKKKRKNFYFGLFAEYLAIILYKIRFYQILYHRKRTIVGEIDLIVVRGKNLVFVEVKARNQELNNDIISLNQQQRIKKAAELFLIQNEKYLFYNVRFDLVFIRIFKFPRIIKNAW